MLQKTIAALEARVLEGGEISGEEAEKLMALSDRETVELFPAANRIARHYKGYDVELCGIINAKSGRCAENCAFCSQSAHHDTDAPVYDLLDADAIVAASRETAGMCANRFGIVTSGTKVRQGAELDRLADAIARIAAAGEVIPCASLGIMEEAALGKLWDAGLRGFHHNLETARSYFPNICTTHDYEDDVATVATAKRLGFMTCSGGIFGLGETGPQRVEMALTLRELDVDAVPMNFLVPVKGTRMETRTPLSPMESLRTIAVYRFLLPQKTIKVCAGRDKNLGDLASWIFYAGANGMMVGNYLTTAGRTPALDLSMIEALGFRPVAEGGHAP